MSTRRNTTRAGALARRAEKSATPLQAPEKRNARDASPPASLTDRLRALYEGSTVPVAEIARLANLTERTIYNYARKLGWRPRVTRAGRGLRSLDPAGLKLRAAQARARLTAPRSAVAIVSAARARDARRRAQGRALAQVRTLETLNATLVVLAAIGAERARDFGRRETAADRAADHLTDVVLAMIDRLATAPSRFAAKGNK
jgi:hypothetical protein